MLTGLHNRIRKLARYPTRIDGYTGFLVMLDEILLREHIRPVSICGFRVHVRTSTPDLDVAISSFYKKEYDHIRLSAPHTIIDAGANIGTSSIFFAHKYPAARIFAIEPEQSNFDLLTLNTKEYQNIVPIHAALWGETCIKTIQNRFTGHWGYTVSETNNRSEPTGQDIRCVTLDSIMAEYGIECIDLLKLDIEGGEKDVLENSQNWIGAVSVITAELHDRICDGCTDAFRSATDDFAAFETHGEKLTGYRSRPVIKPRGGV